MRVLDIPVPMHIEVYGGREAKPPGILRPPLLMVSTLCLTEFKRVL